MKKLTMVLPLAILLTYCSGPNNTQTTDMDVDATTTSPSTAATTDDLVSNSSEASVATTTASTTSTDDATSTLVTTTIPHDPNDPMYQHWQRTNAQHWTYDMDYPGFNRPVAGSYNSAVNGNWQLVMVPELITAWRQDNSRSLWMNGTNTYLSASESFNTKDNVNTNEGAVTDSMNATSGLNNAVTEMDVNSINYNAANGNMYQLPKFNLFLDNGSFTGYTGCNGISGRVEVTGTSLRFLNTNTSTAIECMGGLDQSVLLDLLKRIDSYAYVGEELQLMQGNQVLLRFKKGSEDTSLR